MMPAWKKVWREGIAPLLSTTGLTALARALKEDDPRLLQGATTTPPPLQAVQDWPVEAADAIAFCYVVDYDGFATIPSSVAFRSDGLGLTGTVGTAGCPVADAEEFFARVCFECDQAMGEPAACRRFLNWYDETPRPEMRRLLLPEVNRVLACRRLSLKEDAPDWELHDRAEEEDDIWTRNEMEALDAAAAEG